MFTVFHEVGWPMRGVIRNASTVEGRQIVLHCNHYVSRPPATVTWYSVVVADAQPSSTSLGWTVSSGAPAQPVRADDRVGFDDAGDEISLVDGDEWRLY